MLAHKAASVPDLSGSHGTFGEPLHALGPLWSNRPMDAALLRLAMPRLAASRAVEWAPHVADAMAEFSIIGPKRPAAFLAHLGHESMDFSRLVESFNYSQDGLRATFPKYRVEHLGRRNGETVVPADRQRMIANQVYGGRMGNDAPDDGWRYRGRGAIQITGKENYRLCCVGIGLDLVNAPELLQVLPGAIRSAAWFWASHGCNELADAGEFGKITRVINGGVNGQADRIDRWEVAKRALAE